MRLFGYTIRRTKDVEHGKAQTVKNSEIRGRVIHNLLRFNAKLSDTRCLWCGRTREGALREAEPPKGAGVAI